jgi:hypothetical protein
MSLPFNIFIYLRLSGVFFRVKDFCIKLHCRGHGGALRPLPFARLFFSRVQTIFLHQHIGEWLLMKITWCCVLVPSLRSFRFPKDLQYFGHGNHNFPVNVRCKNSISLRSALDGWLFKVSNEMRYVEKKASKGEWNGHLGCYAIEVYRKTLEWKRRQRWISFLSFEAIMMDELEASAKTLFLLHCWPGSPFCSSRKRKKVEGERVFEYEDLSDEIPKKKTSTATTTTRRHQKGKSRRAKAACLSAWQRWPRNAK